MNRETIAIVGIGQLGGVFAKGFLRLGYPVLPVIRKSNPQQIAESNPGIKLVVAAVAEDDISGTLSNLPHVWRDQICLIQNELLPGDWKRREIENPTVISIWFEKKKGMDSKVLLSSPVFGPNANLIKDALGEVDIPANVLSNEADLEYELVRKNIYIITINIAGLVVGGTVGVLWRDHHDLASEIAGEVLDIQGWLTGSTLDRDRLIKGMLEAIEADPEHKCMGRSAPSRLKRALTFADEAGIKAPKLREIAAKID